MRIAFYVSMYSGFSDACRKMGQKNPIHCKGAIIYSINVEINTHIAFSLPNAKGIMIPTNNHLNVFCSPDSSNRLPYGISEICKSDYSTCTGVFPTDYKMYF